MPQSDHVVVFDLDDTLYKERDYVFSGVAAVTKTCRDLGLTGKDMAEPNFVPDIAGGKFIDELCAHLGLPAKLQSSLLWMYRLHAPQIALDAETRAAMQTISVKAKAIGIITDGRAVTQRLKIAALGLGDIPAFVSEEFDNGKPASDMFLAVQKRWPGCHYSYIGDNLSKDFVAPNALGWFTIGLRDNGKNIHPQTSSIGAGHNDQPRAWAVRFAEVPELVFGNRNSQETPH